jgi:hypothetical protein
MQVGVLRILVLLYQEGKTYGTFMLQVSVSRDGLLDLLRAVLLPPDSGQDVGGSPTNSPPASPAVGLELLKKSLLGGGEGRGGEGGGGIGMRVSGPVELVVARVEAARAGGLVVWGGGRQTATKRMDAAEVSRGVAALRYGE